MKRAGKSKNDWNSAPPSRRKSADKGVTRDQLGNAIQSFVKQGGLIRTLPPQTASRGYSVGGNLESGFETVNDT